VQQALLKILEGTVCNVPPQAGANIPQQEYIRVDTSDILFICGGAFRWMDTHHPAAAGQAPVMGFNAVEQGHKAASVDRMQLLQYIERKIC